MQCAAKLKRWTQAAVMIALVTLVAACGGGGGGNNSSSSSSNNSGSLPSTPNATPVASNAGNAVPITVAAGVAGVINIPTVSVTVCVPGSTTQCQTIPNIQLDTGSYGLRIVSSVLNVALPTVAAPTASSKQLVECTNFADGYSWGSVRTATVQMANETAVSIPVQVLGDVNYTVPTGCASGDEENTVSAIGANGILGIGVAPVDCGTACSGTSFAQYSNYYACAGSSCTATQVPTTSQVTNPVSKFTDNNGVIVEMSAVSNTGSASATGTLVFGINTSTNNALAAAQTYPTDGAGDLNNSSYNGSKLIAFFDTGSNAYFFTDSTLQQCTGSYAGFYCPSSGQTRTVTLGGQSGATGTANIGILSANTLFANGNNYAFNDLGGQIGGTGGSFDLGLPFFYGRYMYFGIDQTASGGQAPFVGF
jgi:hypothetical protein